MGKNAIVQKRLGEKAMTMIYAEKNETNSIINTETPESKRRQYVLEDKEVIQLANWTLLIEEHYHEPMDIEWAKDGISGELFIVQARPETVHSQKNPYQVKEYKLLERGELLTEGNAVGEKAVSGIARILQSPN